MLYGEFELRLVKIVEQHPSLYDTSSPGYKNKPYKASLWQSIANDLRAEVEVVIYKWKNIRDYYLKELKKIASLDKTKKQVKPRHWQMFETLSFLRSYVGIITRPRDPLLQKCKKRVRKMKETIKQEASATESPANSNIDMITHSIFSNGIPEMDFGTSFFNGTEKDNPSTSSNISFETDDQDFLSYNINKVDEETNDTKTFNGLFGKTDKKYITAENEISTENQILVKREMIEDQTSIEDQIPTSIIYTNPTFDENPILEQITFKKEITIEDEYLMENQIQLESQFPMEEGPSTHKENQSLLEAYQSPIEYQSLNKDESPMESQRPIEDQSSLRDQFIEDDIKPDPEVLFFSEFMGAKLSKLSKQSRNTAISGIKNYVISVTENDSIHISY